MRCTGVVLLALCLGSCGSSSTTASAPAHCNDACNNAYSVCGRSVDLGSGTLDEPGCVSACSSSSTPSEWNCVAAAACPAIDACILPMACPGASSFVRTCVGNAEGNSVFAACKARPESFTPCLDCVETTACASMALACAAACPFTGSGGS